MIKGWRAVIETGARWSQGLDDIMESKGMKT
jgi:hypothetical protein